jgi:hypothetical protein
MRQVRWFGVVSCLLLVGACGASRSGAPAKTDDFTYVFISVSPETTEAGAVLVDRHGNRCGWNVRNSYKAIPGCGYTSNTGEGIPDEEPRDTLASAEATDTTDAALLSVEREVPRYHMFRLTRQMGTFDEPGVLGEGVCVLLVEAEKHGRVRIASQAKRGTGSDCGQASVQKVVDSGIRYRWRIEWTPTEDKQCAVRITELGKERIGQTK